MNTSGWKRARREATPRRYRWMLRKPSRQRAGAALKRAWCAPPHDLSEGGLGLALAESTIASPKSSLGAEVWLPEQEGRLDGLLFGEAASRILVSLSPQAESALREAVQSCGAQLTRIGRVQEGAFVIKTPDNAPLIDLTMPEIVVAWSGALSEVL